MSDDTVKDLLTQWKLQKFIEQFEGKYNKQRILTLKPHALDSKILCQCRLHKLFIICKLLLLHEMTVISLKLHVCFLCDIYRGWN